MTKRDKIITLALTLFAASMSLLMLPESTTQIAARENTATAAATLPDYFSEITLEAKAAYVFDIANQKELFAKNADESLPLASIAKIMTTVTAMELAPRSTVVRISLESLHEEGDSGFYVDEKWDLTSLLQYMLVSSSNDGAAAIATSLSGDQSIFVQEMNAEAQRIGLSTMRFMNPTGLDISETEAGAYGSAKDVARMLAFALQRDAEIIEPTRYPSITIESLDGFTHTAPNTDIIVQSVPSLIAGKTGYTVLAGGNLTIIFDAGVQQPIAVVVLGSSYNGRFDDIKKLVDSSIKTIANQ
jgi:D-alanyl-D-alanine carboxypeptidase